MAAPIEKFEIVESIRFFAQLVGTEGIDERVKELGNDYILKLMKALKTNVDEATAKNAGITIVKD